MTSYFHKHGDFMAFSQYSRRCYRARPLAFYNVCLAFVCTLMALQLPALCYFMALTCTVLMAYSRHSFALLINKVYTHVFNSCLFALEQLKPCHLIFYLHIIFNYSCIPFCLTCHANDIGRGRSTLGV